METLEGLALHSAPATRPSTPSLRSASPNPSTPPRHPPPRSLRSASRDATLAAKPPGSARVWLARTAIDLVQSVNPSPASPGKSGSEPRLRARVDPENECPFRWVGQRRPVRPNGPRRSPRWARAGSGFGNGLAAESVAERPRWFPRRGHPRKCSPWWQYTSDRPR